MKITLGKKLFLLAAIILLSFSSGTILAGNQFHQEKANQQIEQKNKNHTIEEIKETPNGQIRAEPKTFDYGFLTNLFAILVSASLIIWQINRQHKNNIKLQRENNREKLKLELYTEYRKTISEASVNGLFKLSHFRS